MTRIFAVVLVVASSVLAQGQQVPLDSCNRLSMVKVDAGKQHYQFLLDTGAVSTLLNLKHFSSADAIDINMETWNGTTSTQAREVALPDFTVGGHTLTNLKLLSVDLTPLERSCQRRVDGVLGADLIEKLALTIDLKNHIAVLPEDSKTSQARFSELDQQESACEQAFNRSDAKAFEDCLNPDVVLVTSNGYYHGRKAVIEHIKQNYFGQDPAVRVSFTPHEHHALGAVIWTEYEMSVTTCSEVVKARGTVLYQKTGERWRMSNINYPVFEQPK
jgi:hypothetical protein